MKSTFKNIIFYVLLIGIIFALSYALISFSAEDKIIYQDIVDLFNGTYTDSKGNPDSILEVTLDTTNKLTIKTLNGKKIEFRIQDRDIFKDDCWTKENLERISNTQKVVDNKVIYGKYNLKEPTYIPTWLSVIPYVLIIVFFIGVFIYIARQATDKKGGSSSGGGGFFSAASFGKSRAKLAPTDPKKKVTFKDVAGADEEKEELEEIVAFLKDPDYFTKLGAKIPHGVLLVGPPGTGKTLLAKATAGEADVPFFSISGSDFVEMYVGVGAARVRDLFENARKFPASIIFIDEIDAVGRHRGAGLGGGHDEREQTLNQLLVEMDGFLGNEGIIVMAATNRHDILDPALLRPGRFDRQIVVNYPDLKGREDILKVHARNKPFESDVDLRAVAETTVGFTGADLANLLNESALLAAKRGKELIGMNDIQDATLRIIVGTEKKNKKIKENEKLKTAYHEAGHAIVSHLLPSVDPVKRISIIPSGMALGYTLNVPTEDKYSEYKNDLIEEIMVLLAGRAAEKITFDDISGGASNDIQRATDIARKMVTKLGMSDELGPIVFGTSQGEVFLGRDIANSRNYSEEIAAKIDSEIHSIITGAYKRAEEILCEHKEKLKFIAEFLVKYETMDEMQFNAAMNGTPTFEDLEALVSEMRRKSEFENEQAKERKLKLEEERKKAEAEKNDNTNNQNNTDSGEKMDNQSDDSDIISF